MSLDTTDDSSDAGDVVKQAAAAMDMPAMTAGMAPTAAKASGAMTMALPPPMPDM